MQSEFSVYRLADSFTILKRNLNRNLKKGIFNTPKYKLDKRTCGQS